jgi:hypothetical protein
MFVFAIETNGKTVAFTKETDRVMLNGVLNGDREEGQELRSVLSRTRDNTGALWNGVSPFTARLATDSEDLDYDDIATNADENGECLGYYFQTNGDGNTVLIML